MYPLHFHKDADALVGRLRHSPRRWRRCKCLSSLYLCANACARSNLLASAPQTIRGDFADAILKIVIVRIPFRLLEQFDRTSAGLSSFSPAISLPSPNVYVSNIKVANAPPTVNPLSKAKPRPARRVLTGAISAALIVSAYYLLWEATTTTAFFSQCYRRVVNKFSAVIQTDSQRFRFFF